jgi:hypothetical protein
MGPKRSHPVAEWPIFARFSPVFVRFHPFLPVFTRADVCCFGHKDWPARELVMPTPVARRYAEKKMRYVLGATDANAQSIEGISKRNPIADRTFGGVVKRFDRNDKWKPGGKRCPEGRMAGETSAECKV